MRQFDVFYIMDYKIFLRFLLEVFFSIHRWFSVSPVYLLRWDINISPFGFYFSNGTSAAFLLLFLDLGFKLGHCIIYFFCVLNLPNITGGCE
ncbi:MAG: hypothetical protein OEV66_08655 [Spirochaetia bacterium]|nr:hypothetical protein [Spirochaetia bacterium]